MQRVGAATAETRPPAPRARSRESTRRGGGSSNSRCGPASWTEADLATIAAAAREGRITVRQAQLLAGYLVLRDEGVLPPRRSTGFNRRAGLRALGIDA